MTEDSLLRVLLLETILYIVAISILTFYYVYIWRNSKKTVLLQSYLAMHILAILLLLSKYTITIAPDDTIVLVTIFIYKSIKVFFILSSVIFGYYLLKGRILNFFNLAILIGLIATLVMELLFANGLFNSSIDISPILVLLVFTFHFFIAYRYGLLYTLSMGIVKSLQMFNNAVLVFDETGEILYANEAKNRFEDEVMESVKTVCQDLIKKNLLSRAEFYKKEFQFPEYGKVLTVWMRPTKSTYKGTIGYISIIHDDTIIINMIDDLKEKNQQLEEINEGIKMYTEDLKKLVAIEERNILSKEIHDVLGHSLNYTLKVLESNKIIIDSKPEKAIERLKAAVIEIDKGLGEIRAASINRDNTLLMDFSSFSEELRKMALRHKEIGVEIDIVSLDDLPTNNKMIFSTFYRICQEAVTNSIKHGQANQVIISITNRGNQGILRIVDNGKGCLNIIKGSGLLGMEERIGVIGGDIVSNSFDDGSGFQVCATIPLDN